MNKSLKLLVCLLSVNAARAMNSQVAAAGSQEEVLPEVTVDNYTELIPTLYKSGGKAQLKRELLSLTQKHLATILNPNIVGKDERETPLEYAFNRSDEELFLWFLRQGANSETLNSRGKPIHEVVDEQPYIDHMTYDRKRKKVEPLVIDALQGISLEQVAKRLHELIETAEDALVEKREEEMVVDEESPKIEIVDINAITREDIIKILEDILNEGAESTKIVAELLSTYRGEPTEVIAKKGFDNKLVLLTGLLIGSFLTWGFINASNDDGIN